MKIPFLKQNKKKALQHIDLPNIAPDTKDPSIIFPNKNNSLLNLTPGSIWDINIQGEKVNSKRIK